MNAVALTDYLHPKTNEVTQNRRLTESSEVLRGIFQTSCFHLFLSQSENKAKKPWDTFTVPKIPVITEFQLSFL